MDIIAKKNDPVVKVHIDMLQGIIGRMEQNSKNCKQWCVAVETILFAVSKENLNIWTFICFAIAAILFMFQDAGYLSFGRYFRQQQSDLIEKINSGKDYSKDLLDVKRLKKSERMSSMLKAAISVYVYPYYLTTVLLMLCYILHY